MHVRRASIRQLIYATLCTVILLSVLSCSTKPDANTLVVIIESSPTNLDPRVGLDAPSERIDSLIFDDLLSRGGDSDLNVAPAWLANALKLPTRSPTLFICTTA